MNIHYITVLDLVCPCFPSSYLVVDGFSCGSFMNCKSLKPKDHYFWFQLQSEENDRSVHFLVRVMLKLEKDATGSPLKSHCFHRSHLNLGLHESRFHFNIYSKHPNVQTVINYNVCTMYIHLYFVLSLHKVLKFKDLAIEQRG